MPLRVAKLTVSKVKKSLRTSEILISIKIIVEVDKFPSLEREKSEGTNSIERGRGSTSSAQKLTDLNHNREVIFALPSLQLHLKTEHLQTAQVPDLSSKCAYVRKTSCRYRIVFMSRERSLKVCFCAVGEKAKVECSFITEFEDHIFVTVDAELFFFLHDLITSYLKEKEKVRS